MSAVLGQQGVLLAVQWVSTLVRLVVMIVPMVVFRL